MNILRLTDQELAVHHWSPVLQRDFKKASRRLTSKNIRHRWAKYGHGGEVWFVLIPVTAMPLIDDLELANPVQCTGFDATSRPVPVVFEEPRFRRVTIKSLPR